MTTRASAFFCATLIVAVIVADVAGDDQVSIFVPISFGQN
jgi:hypothetical protein